MKFIVKVLQESTFTRMGSWLAASLLLAAVGVLLMSIITELCINFFEIESIPHRYGVVLGAQILTLMIPAHILTRLSPNHPRVPKIHLVISIGALLLVDETMQIVITFFLLQIDIWMEVVGIFWIRKLKHL